MSIVIYKYTLHDNADNSTCSISMPQGAKVLTAQAQYNDICIWALIDTQRPKELRYFRVCGTGWNIPEKPGAYIATVQLSAGALVFHVFEESNALPS